MSAATRGAGVERLDAFAAACHFLSRLFLVPPREELLATLSDPGLWDDWPLRGDQETDEGLAAIRLALTGGPQGPPESLADLQADHKRLLLGPGHVLASPYESVYRSDEHLVFEQQTLAVRRCYARFGLQAPSMHQEPDDHVGLELDFVAHLCRAALDAVDDRDDETVSVVVQALGEFGRDHLQWWVFDFLRRLEDGARTSFYRGVAALTRGTVQQLRMAYP